MIRIQSLIKQNFKLRLVYRMERTEQEIFNRLLEKYKDIQIINLVKITAPVSSFVLHFPKKTKLKYWLSKVFIRRDLEKSGHL